MFSIKRIWGLFPILSVLLATYICIPMTTGHAVSIEIENLNTTENETETDTTDTEKCMPVDDCDFFAWFIDNGNYGIPGFNKTVVDNLLKEDSCEENGNGDVLKGSTTPFAFQLGLKL